MSRRFEGKAALVTGAGSGIGQAVAVAVKVALHHLDVKLLLAIRRVVVKRGVAHIHGPGNLCQLHRRITTFGEHPLCCVEDGLMGGVGDRAHSTKL